MSKLLDVSEDEQIWEPKASTVPESWAQVDFLSAFDAVSVNKKKVPAKSYLSEGKLPIVDQSQQFIGGYTNDLSLEIDPGEGLVIFGDHTRVFKRIAFPFAAGADGIKVLRPLLSNSTYAYYACQSLQFPNKGYSRHYSYLSKCRFPVAPELEQRRIISKIDQLFSCIEEGERALERVQKLVGRYSQSVLKAAVTGELTREWREKHKGQLESGEALLARILKARREAWEKSELDKMKAKGQKPKDDQWKQKYREAVSPDTTKLPDLPKGWAWASIDQLTTKITSGSRDWKDFYGRGDGVFVMAQNVRKRRLDWTEIQLVDPPEDDRDAKRSEVAQNDLLVTIVGANTGDVCRVPNPVVRHYVCQSVALMRPVDGHSAYFLELFLAAEEGGQAQFKEVIYGAGRPHLSFDQLRSLSIPFPGLVEQGAIADRLNIEESNIAKVHEAVYASSKRARSLRQATLKSAFSGNLVPQEPSDEPAYILLQRITVERNSPKKQPPPKAPRKKKVSA